jgi:hypothetical protein
LTIVEQALEAIANRDMELGNLIATPIARSMLYILSSKGVKHPEKEQHSINPFGKILESIEARKIFSKEFANTFAELLKEGRVPNWVVSAIDIESINLAR